MLHERRFPLPFSEMTKLDKHEENNFNYTLQNVFESLLFDHRTEDYDLTFNSLLEDTNDDSIKLRLKCHRSNSQIVKDLDVATGDLNTPELIVYGKTDSTKVVCGAGKGCEPSYPADCIAPKDQKGMLILISLIYYK